MNEKHFVVQAWRIGKLGETATEVGSSATVAGACDIAAARFQMSKRESALMHRQQFADLDASLDGYDWVGLRGCDCDYPHSHG